MNKAQLIERLIDILRDEELNLYNLYEVYSLVFDLNEILLGQGEIMSLFPQNNKLGDALAGDKISEVEFAPITTSFAGADYNLVQTAFLARAQEIAE